MGDEGDKDKGKIIQMPSAGKKVLEPGEGEEVLVFGTGAKRYIGIISKQNPRTTPLNFRDVHEITIYTVPQANPITKQMQMITQVAINPPDICSLDHKPVESMLVHVLEWEYRPTAEVLKIVQRDIKNRSA